MARATVGISIARPVEQVFGILTDVEKTGVWFPLQLEESWTTPPPHGVGSARHAVITILGRRSENDATVIEYDPPRHAAVRGTQLGISSTTTLDFAADGSGTRVDVAFEFTGAGPRRLVLGLFVRWYRSLWRRGLANAKRMMEAGEL
jgi:uncharacterized protein YndB with AHSA1/START domain